MRLKGPGNWATRGRAVVGAAVTLALVAGACGSSRDTTSTVDAIRRRGKLAVGIRFEPGLATRDPATGTYDGFNARIAYGLAVGIFGGTRGTIADKIEFVDTKSKDRATDIEDGVVDIGVASFTINDERKQVVDFAGPYLIDHQDIMVAAGDTSISGVTDLGGRRVCTVTGTTSAANLAAKAPEAQVTLFDTFTECADALADGRVDAVTTDRTILAGLAAGGGGAFRLVNASFSDEPWGVGMAKGDDGFRTFLDDRLDNMVRNGEWAHAFSETLGKLGLPTPSPPRVDRYRSVPTQTTSTVA